MKITILTVGKVKEKYFTGAIQEYSKRLSRYCKLEIIEVADEKTPDHASEREEELIRRKEGERLAKYIREDAYVIALAIEGKQMPSEAFAKKLDHWESKEKVISFLLLVAPSDLIRISCKMRMNC